MLNTVIICGLIRKENILIKMIDIYLKLKREGIIHEIIIGTDSNHWINNKLKRYFINKGIIYKEYDNLSIEEIKNIDPDVDKKPIDKLRKKNNSITIWKELYNIRQTLLDIPENRYILKTRSDLYLCYELVKDIFTKYKVKLDNDILDYKIWAPAFGYKEMLWVIDFAFSGSKKNLLEACHMNSESFKWNPKNYYGFNVSDTIWWTYIFNNKFPEVKLFIENFRNSNPKVQVYDNELYFRCISVWLHILEDYFVIDNLDNKKFIFYPNWGDTWCIDYNRFQNKSWLEKFKEGNFNNDRILNNIYVYYKNNLINHFK